MMHTLQNSVQVLTRYVISKANPYLVHAPFTIPNIHTKIIRRLYNWIHNHANAPTIAISVAPKITAVKA